MNAEQLAAHYLRCVVFWRLVATVFAFPCKLIGSFAGFFGDLQGDVFLLELHAANRYRLLTGSDLGVAAGEGHRYLGMTPDAVETALADIGSHEVDPDDED